MQTTIYPDKKEHILSTKSLSMQHNIGKAVEHQLSKHQSINWKLGKTRWGEKSTCNISRQMLPY
jgi:hypothetical protein